MRILHYYDNSDDMVSQHVKLLTGGMGLEADNHQATESEQAKTLLKGGQYDLLHIHGCWRNSQRAIVREALRQGVRIVLTPHGQLQPWVQDERFWGEKLPKRLLYQRDIVERAYAVIVQGQMELGCMDRLGWNPRTVVIRNAVLTSSISPTDMARQTSRVYRKVLDSNTLELMSEETRDALRDMLTAGITGDRRWLKAGDDTPAEGYSISQDEWRKLLCYAHQEQIMETIQRGIRVLDLDAPDLDVSKIDYFLPASFKQTESIQNAIGNQFPSENERLLATFRVLRKWSVGTRLGISHLVELDRELRSYACEESELNEELKDRRLWSLASRLMQLMSELTGLTEGFMPVVPTDDRTTRRLRRQIDNHLHI